MYNEDFQKGYAGYKIMRAFKRLIFTKTLFKILIIIAVAAVIYKNIYKYILN